MAQWCVKFLVEELSPEVILSCEEKIGVVRLGVPASVASLTCGVLWGPPGQFFSARHVLHDSVTVLLGDMFKCFAVYALRELVRKLRSELSSMNLRAVT